MTAPDSFAPTPGAGMGAWGAGDWMAFLDESYSGRDYWIAAVVLDPGQLAALTGGFAAIRVEAARRWGVPAGVEFHARALMQSRGEWSPLRGDVGAAASVYRHLLRVIVDSGAQVAVQGVDVVRLNVRFQYPATPHVKQEHIVTTPPESTPSLSAPLRRGSRVEQAGVW